MNLRNTVISTLGAAAILAATAFTGATAQTTDDGDATVTITAGQLFVSVTDASFGDVPYSFDEQTTAPEVITINAIDATGDGEGWTVNLSVGDFVGATYMFDADNLNYLPLYDITPVDGDSDTTAMTVNYADGDAPQGTWTAPENSGEGEYDLELTFDLTIPAGQRVDAYKSELTVEISTAP